MKKRSKTLSKILVFILTSVMLLNSIVVQAAEKQTIVPKVAYVKAPTLEYTVGDTVFFDLHAPNYGGRVQYRVLLWDNNKKQARDLWTKGDKYYTNWMPYGNNNFNLHWRIDEPGSYRITVYVKRAGLLNSNTALKGYNCDSYMESQAFVVKAKVTVFDKGGQTYGSIDENKVEAYNSDINITGQNVIFNNAKLEGNLTITGDNAIIKNVNIVGNIVIDPGKNGSCTLENVTAKDVKVISGGQNSIHIKNSNIGTMNVNSENAVRIEVDGDTKIISTSASGYVIFDRKNGTFGNITITKDEKGESVIEFRGDIKDKVEVETSATIKTGQASKIANLVINTDTVRLEGQFGRVEISNEAKQGVEANTNLEVAANTKIENIVADNDTVIKLDKTSSITNVEKKGNEVVIIGEGNAGSDTPPVNGGGYIPPVVGVSVITITSAGDASIVVNGGSLQMSVVVTPANATNKTVTWSVTNKTGSATIDANGLLKGVGIGNIIVKATNLYSGISGIKEITVITIAEELAAAKVIAKGELSTVLSNYTAVDYTVGNWAVLTTAKTNGDTAIDTAADLAAVGIAKTTALGEMDAVETIAETLAAAKVIAKGELSTALSNYTEVDYTAGNWAVLTTAKTNGDTAIDTAADLVAVGTAKTTALDEMNAVEAMAETLAAAEAAAIAAINGAANEGQMATAITDNAAILGLVLTDYNALTNKVPVQTALLAPIFTDKAAVKTTFDTAVAVQKIAEELAATKVIAKGELSTALSNYTEVDYTIGNWAVLTTAKTNGDTAINTAADLTAVGTAKKTALDEMDAVETITETLAAANVVSVTAAKDVVTGTAYTMTQAAATDEATVKAAIESIISGFVLDNVTITITKVHYTPAVAGAVGTPFGTNGTYTFIAVLSKGTDATLATDTTSTLKMTIIATAIPKESITSNTITNFNYETVCVTQAKAVSLSIDTSTFKNSTLKSFTITDRMGNIIPINMNVNIPLNEYTPTYAAAVGSYAESIIQMWFKKTYGLTNWISQMTVSASYDNDRLVISTFELGSNAFVQISSSNWPYFSNNSDKVYGTDDTSLNRLFIINDGTNTLEITLAARYVDMTCLVNAMNDMLSQSLVNAIVEKVDESHFKLVTKTPGIHLTISGANKGEFFSSFESQ